MLHLVRTALRDLRVAVLTVLFVAFAALAAGQWLVARLVYDVSFARAEEREALAQARHAQAIVAFPLEILRRHTIDNGMWDEAYDFMRGRNPNHPNNLIPMIDSFRLMRMSAYGFVGPDGRLLYARQFDALRQHLEPVSPGIADALGPHGFIGSRGAPGDVAAGFLRIDGAIYNWVAAPVLHSNGTGPAMGYWVLLSKLDSGFLDATSQAVGSPTHFAIRPLSEGPRSAHNPLAADDVTLALSSENTFDVRFLLGPIDRDSALEVVLTSPRVAYAAFHGASQYLFWTTLVFGTLLSAMALWFVGWRLIQPVRQASRALVDIGRSGDLSRRLGMTGREDEIGQLAAAADLMLSELESRRDVEAAMLRAIPDALVRVDSADRVVDARLPEQDQTLAPWCVPGQRLGAGQTGEALDALLGALHDVRLTGTNQNVEFSLPKGLAAPAHFEARITPIKGGEALLLVRDITQRKEADRRIAHLAYFDGLTNLPNRTAFLERLGREVQRAERDSAQLGVLFLDLDGFKQINDTLGHSFGDRVLLWTAERLREALRPSDGVYRADSTMARLGGDEFTLLISDVGGPAEALSVAHRISAEMRQPFHIDGKEIMLTSSIGVAVFPEDGRTAQALLEHADTAMYYAKRNGRDNCQLYSTSLTSAAIDRLELENSLRHALARGEFNLVYQPIVDVATGRMGSVEALLRWQHPTRGAVSPAVFIPLAEECGLIAEIGGFVFHTACADLARWRQSGLDLRVAINVSPKQFGQSDFVASVFRALARHGVPPFALEIEITEGAVIEKFAATVACLQAFRSHGVRIALDDFGTGYSSLSYLTQIPIDVIKVDRSFVSRLPDREHSASIVRAILVLARTLGVSVTAEGVETLEQVNSLRDMGCTRLQGYFLSHPAPRGQVPELAARTWEIAPRAVEI